MASVFLQVTSLILAIVPLDFKSILGVSESGGKDRKRYSRALGIKPGSWAVPTIVKVFPKTI